MPGWCRCNRLRCPLTRLSGLQCLNMGHNGHGINLYGVVMTFMGNLHAGGQSNLEHLSLVHRVCHSTMEPVSFLHCNSNTHYYIFQISRYVLHVMGMCMYYIVFDNTCNGMLLKYIWIFLNTEKCPFTYYLLDALLLIDLSLTKYIIFVAIIDPINDQIFKDTHLTFRYHVMKTKM